MARLTAPLLSLDARGQIGKALVFSGWKGIKYARQYVIPANPNTGNQQEVRGVFITLNELWKRMPQLGRDPFQAFVEGLALTDRNKHIGANAVLLRADNDFSNYIWSVSSGAALPPAGFVSDGVADAVRCRDFTVPTPPPGHTFLKRVCACIERGDPKDGIIRTMYAAESADPAANFQIDGVPSGTYRSGGWVGWTRDSDGKVFYGIFIASGAVVP